MPRRSQVYLELNELLNEGLKERIVFPNDKGGIDLTSEDKRGLYVVSPSGQGTPNPIQDQVSLELLGYMVDCYARDFGTANDLAEELEDLLDDYQPRFFSFYSVEANPQRQEGTQQHQVRVEIILAYLPTKRITDDE